MGALLRIAGFFFFFSLVALDLVFFVNIGVDMSGALVLLVRSQIVLRLGFPALRLGGKARILRMVLSCRPKS